MMPLMTGYNSYFPNPLITRHLPDGVILEVHTSEFVFHDPVEGIIIVPIGATTDLASIPRIFWVVLPPFGKYKFGAVIHDLLYRNLVFGTGFWAWRRADKVLWRAMRYAPNEVPSYIRAAIYLGLLVGGWWTYWGYVRALRKTGPTPQPS